MELEEKLEELNSWIEDDDQFDEIVTRRLIASHSKLGVMVYHYARDSKTYVGQRYEIEYKGNTYPVTFTSHIKPKIAALLEENKDE